MIDRENLRRAVRHFYDLQKLRVSAGNRDHRDREGDAPPPDLDAHDQAFMATQSDGLKALEASTLKEIKRHLKPFPIAKWLGEQNGCGPTMAGVLLAEIDIARCNTPSALWAYCGLAVDSGTGKAVRRQKGVKSNWNPFLKTKVVHVLGGSFLKANSPWRKFYDDYKHRKQNTLVPVCMACEGNGKVGKESCKNCGGKGKNAPWGRSDGHRHNAALRYMVKMFLAELWVQWRTLEGLPVTDPYAVAVLGREHGDHWGTALQA